MRSWPTFGSLLLIQLFAFNAPALAQTESATSGGSLLPEQAAFDVRFYDLVIRVAPTDSTIVGRLQATVTALLPLDEVVLHLDDRLSVSGAGTVTRGAANEAAFHHGQGLLRLSLSQTVTPGEDITVWIEYGGRPLASEAPQTSWGDGFTWSTTSTGEPWIGVVSVLQGADLWWPTKDHPSDEPDSMAIHVRVPDPLRVVANGQSRGVESHGDGTSTHHWFVSTPINNYGVSINVAPYELLDTTFASVTGERFPFQFWVLPERLEDGRRLFEEMQAHMRFFERLFGPYPFRSDKYAVAHTPYVAMEHQSVIAYGSTFQQNSFGFDYYHLHELAHEWWGNKLTVGDWRDWWLHEGFARYTEALYAEELGGIDVYHEYAAGWRGRIANQTPVVTDANSTTHDVYTGDIYNKGADVLHMIRYVIGREALLEVMRRMQEQPGAPGGEACGCRAITTDGFRQMILQVTGRDLKRLLDVYLRQTELPRLKVTEPAGRLELTWTAPDGGLFELPVEVRVNDELIRVEMTDGRGSLTVPVGADVEIDPLNWILMNEEG